MFGNPHSQLMEEIRRGGFPLLRKNPSKQLLNLPKKPKVEHRDTVTIVSIDEPHPLLHQLRELYLKNDYADIKLSSHDDGTMVIPAHRLVLAQSYVLRRWFLEHGHEETCVLQRVLHRDVVNNDSSSGDETVIMTDQVFETLTSLFYGNPIQIENESVVMDVWNLLLELQAYSVANQWLTTFKEYNALNFTRLIYFWKTHLMHLDASLNICEDQSATLGAGTLLTCLEDHMHTYISRHMVQLKLTFIEAAKLEFTPKLMSTFVKQFSKTTNWDFIIQLLDAWAGDDTNRMEHIGELLLEFDEQLSKETPYGSIPPPPTRVIPPPPTYVLPPRHAHVPTPPAHAPSQLPNLASAILLH